MITIPTGTFLYTGCNISLTPQDDYWFAFDREAANQYNGGRMVVKYRVKHPLRVYDIQSVEFQTLCAGMGNMACAPFGYPDCPTVEKCLIKLNVPYPCIFQLNDSKLFSKFYGQYTYKGMPWISYTTKKTRTKMIGGVGIVWPVRTENMVLQQQFEPEICLFDTQDIEYIDTYTSSSIAAHDDARIDDLHMSDSFCLPGCPASPRKS